MSFEIIGDNGENPIAELGKNLVSLSHKHVEARGKRQEITRHIRVSGIVKKNIETSKEFVELSEKQLELSRLKTEKEFKCACLQERINELKDEMRRVESEYAAKVVELTGQIGKLSNLVTKLRHRYEKDFLKSLSRPLSRASSKTLNRRLAVFELAGNAFLLMNILNAPDAPKEVIDLVTKSLLLKYVKVGDLIDSDFDSVIRKYITWFFRKRDEGKLPRKIDFFSMVNWAIPTAEDSIAFINNIVESVVAFEESRETKSEAADGT
jgi:ACT domain-containing protein